MNFSRQTLATMKFFVILPCEDEFNVDLTFWKVFLSQNVNYANVFKAFHENVVQLHFRIFVVAAESVCF